MARRGYGTRLRMNNFDWLKADDPNEDQTNGKHCCTATLVDVKSDIDAYNCS
jgi:hypothetical protein